MAMQGAILEGRKAFARQEWRAAYARFGAADEAGPLEPDDLERFAAAAYLVGEEAQATALWARLHHALVDNGDAPRAARWGYWLSLNLLLANDMARSAGWLARSERLLKDRQDDCAEAGYGRIVAGLMAMGGGDVDAADGHFRAALALAEDSGDADLLTVSLLAQGELFIHSQRIGEGIARLDEAMLAIVAGEVSPIFAGMVYCAVILACHRIFDVHRAREWTLAMNEWCAAQPDLVPFRGQCLVHRSEILQWRGDWAGALQEAERACAQLAGRSEGVVGRALYQRGELCRLVGDFPAAEKMYREAGRFGCEPQPGLSLLRLAQGDPQAAVASMRALVASIGARQAPAVALTRARLLGPFVEMLLAAGEVDAADAAAKELAGLAERIDSPFLRAASAMATGSVLLARGEAAGASACLREAWTCWQQLEMPYEAARAQVLIARACRDLGDRETAELHVQAARSVFSRLKAKPDLAALDQAAPSRDGITSGGLTDREIEVLGLVAAGETNRRIAATLAISEHTVARHLSNIYNKLGVTSRTAASTRAHRNKLIRSHPG